MRQNSTILIAEIMINVHQKERKGGFSLAQKRNNFLCFSASFNSYEIIKDATGDILLALLDIKPPKSNCIFLILFYVCFALSYSM